MLLFLCFKKISIPQAVKKIIPTISIKIFDKLLVVFFVLLEIDIFSLEISVGEIIEPLCVLSPKTEVGKTFDVGDIEGMEVGVFGTGVGVGVFVGVGVEVGVEVEVGIRVGVGGKFIVISTEDITSPDPKAPEVVYLLTLSLYIPLPVKSFELGFPTRP